MQASAVGYIINRGRLYWPQIITASFCIPFMFYRMVSQCVHVGPPATNRKIFSAGAESLPVYIHPNYHNKHMMAMFRPTHRTTAQILGFVWREEVGGDRIAAAFILQCGKKRLKNSP